MYRIRLLGDPILRKKSKKIEVFDDGLKEIASNMLQTMYANDGVGLAAPQVGFSIRLFVMDAGDGPRIVVNPEILEMSEEKLEGEEGCLSIPDVFEYVERSKSVKVRYLDTLGNVHEETLEGYPARVFQHEYDHLEGILFIDRLNPVKRALLRGKLLEIIKKSREILKQTR